MQYLLMCSFNEKAWSQLPHGERDQIVKNYGSCIQEMKRSGHYLKGVKVHHRTGSVVRRRNGCPWVPAAGVCESAHDQLDRNHLVECKSLSEAVSLAKQIPSRSGGTVEVRAVLAQSQG